MRRGQEVIAWIDLCDAERGRYPGRSGDHVPARPFVDWIYGEIRRMEKMAVVEAPERELARRCSLNPRALWRYKRMLRAGGRGGRKGDVPTITFPRGGVEVALEAAGRGIWEIYPEIDDHLLDDAGGVREGYCPGCDETVLVDETGTCLWCDEATTAAVVA